jgi:dTDP-4-amino-4,6-dideoxygalactose transaminase
LHLATMALGLKPGDEVIVPAFTWVTSAHAAEYVGARAVFADVDPVTFNLDPAAFEAAITPRTRAVVVVHLFGLAAPMNELLAIARARGIAVIEDAACAVGASYRGRPVGAIGDIGCFSFHPRKVITTGEGGLVTTDRDDLADRVRSLRNHGAGGLPSGVDATRAYAMSRFVNLGYNLRLSDIQAAVGIAQFAKLERLLQERRQLANGYDRLLSETEGLVLPVEPDYAVHTYQSYVVRVRDGGRERRNAIMDMLTAKGIQTRPGTHAVHRLEYYSSKYTLRPEAYPNAVASEDSSITLPIFPGMTEADQVFVVDALGEALSTR